METTDRREPLEITPEMIRAFLNDQTRNSFSSGTINSYSRYLKRLYDSLPEGAKKIDKNTIYETRQALYKKGYAAQTINTFVSACNSFLEYYERRDLQDLTYLKKDDVIQPELTRSEYLRMLSAARQLDDQRTYLLVKVFTLMAIDVHVLRNVTVESVKQGHIRDAKGKQVRVPAVLRRELLAYARNESIASGTVFITRNSIPMNRTFISKLIGNLSAAARVNRKKCNPRSLRKLGQQTIGDIWENYEILVEQAYNRLLEKEQTVYGWYEAQK